MKRKKANPTVSDTFEVDKAARAIFEAWLPGKWLPRKQDPDYHVDYRVEVVTEGEPSGLNFQTQIKGRSVHRRANKKLAEPLKTKHLRYYLRCEEPVFVFLIDPASRKGNWLFAQRYLRENGLIKELRAKKTLTLHFDSERCLRNQSLFQKDLTEAWAYMRELHPGSPLAAVLAEKRRLESLDPRCAVHIVATPSSQTLQIRPRQPSCTFHSPTLKFSNDSMDPEIQALFEKGEPLQISAADLKVEDSPIMSELLRQLGETKITLNSGATFKGCIHLVPRSSIANRVIQVDGEWLIAPKRASFRGQLSESPLKIKLTWQPGDAEKSGPGGVVFGFEPTNWEGQPLQGLAFFDQIYDLVKAAEYDMVGFIRGNPMFKANYLFPKGKPVDQVVETMEWLRRCRLAARKLGVNPALPEIEKLREGPSDTVQLLVKIMECGSHEQDNSGQELEVSADAPVEGTAALPEPLKIERSEPESLVDFFGISVPFGPLHHTWTEMHLVSTKPLGSNRISLTFRGGAKSTWRIEHKQQADRPFGLADSDS